MSLKKQSKHSGFTLIELLVATTIFTVVLLVFLVAFLNISKLFYKGVSLIRTQETARTVLQFISDDLRLSTYSPQAGNYFCIGTHRYVWFPHQQVDPGAHQDGIIRTDVPINCPDTAHDAGTNAVELLDPGMQVNKLQILPSGPKEFTVNTNILYYGTDNKVFYAAGYDSDPNSMGYNADTAPDAQCNGGLNTTQFCAASNYSRFILQN